MPSELDKSRVETYPPELEQVRSEGEPPAAGPPVPKRKPRLLPVLIVVGAIAAGAALWFWLHYRGRVSTDDAQVDGHIAPISSRVPGTVLQVLVDNNWHVKAGQILVRLDPRDYQARVDQAKAALGVAESQANAAHVGVPLVQQTTTSGTGAAQAALETAEAQYRQAQVAARQAETSEIQVARANLNAAEANNTRAQADLARMKPLVDKEEISRQQYDAYVAAAQVAQASLRAAQDRLSATEQQAANARAAEVAARSKVAEARAKLESSRANEGQVKVSTAQAASAASRVQQARADLEAAELQHSYTTIMAPLDGAVTRKTVEVGQMVQPGQSLMTVIPLHDTWVTANFKETQLEHVHPGQPADVKVDMYGTTIRGRVDSIAGATGARLSLLPPENATGNFVKVVQRIPVKIVFDSMPPNVILRPGMNVEATIFTNR